MQQKSEVVSLHPLVEYATEVVARHSKEICDEEFMKKAYIYITKCFRLYDKYYTSNEEEINLVAQQELRLDCSRQLRACLGELENRLLNYFIVTISAADDRIHPTMDEQNFPNDLYALLDTLGIIQTIWYSLEIAVLSHSMPLQVLSIETIKLFKRACSKYDYEKLNSSKNSLLCSLKWNRLSAVGAPAKYGGNNLQDDYWTVMYHLALHGDLTMLRDCLYCNDTIKNESNFLAQYDFYNIFDNHPFAAFVNNQIGKDKIDFALNFYVRELERWRSYFRHMLGAFENNHKFNNIIEHLRNICGILCGDENTILRLCRDKIRVDGWVTFVVASLLYQYAIPLNFSQISDIVSHSREICPQNSSDNPALGDILTRVFSHTSKKKGDPREVINDLLQLASFTPKVYVLSPVSKLITSFTCTHIVMLLSDECDIIDLHVSEERLLERLLMDTLLLLSNAGYPLELICAYLHYKFLSFDSIEGFVSNVLARRYVETDHDVVMFRKLLLDFENEDVEQLKAIVRSIEISRGTYWLTKRGVPNRLSKAIYFYELAEDNDRVIAILDRVVCQLMNSVYMDQLFFSTLSLGPGRPIGYSCRGRIGSTEFLDYNCNISDPDKMIDDDVEHPSLPLERAIKIAEDVLLSISDTSGIHSDGYGRNLFSTLDDYVFCIKQCREEMPVNGAPSNLEDSGKKLVKLILDKIAPKRFWLHIIDVAVWCHNVYAKSSNDTFGSSSNIYSIYDKNDVYALMVSLESTMNSYTGVDGLACVRVDANLQLIIKELRLKLLGVLTSSYMQNNHDSGSNVQPRIGGSSIRSTSHRAYDSLTGTSVKNYM